MGGESLAKTRPSRVTLRLVFAEAGRALPPVTGVAAERPNCSMPAQWPLSLEGHGGHRCLPQGGSRFRLVVRASSPENIRGLVELPGYRNGGSGLSGRPGEQGVWKHACHPRQKVTSRPRR